MRPRAQASFPRRSASARPRHSRAGVGPRTAPDCRRPSRSQRNAGAVIVRADADAVFAEPFDQRIEVRTIDDGRYRWSSCRPRAGRTFAKLGQRDHRCRRMASSCLFGQIAWRRRDGVDVGWRFAMSGASDSLGNVPKALLVLMRQINQGFSCDCTRGSAACRPSVRPGP